MKRRGICCVSAVTPASSPTKCGENTIAVIEGVKAKLEQVRKALPKEVTVTITRDDSKFIYAAIASLEEHLVWGSFLAGLVVMFFIRNLRAVIIAWLAIPASIVATFTSVWRLEAPGTWRIVFDKGNDVCDCAPKSGG